MTAEAAHLHEQQVRRMDELLEKMDEIRHIFDRYSGRFVSDSGESQCGGVRGGCKECVEALLELHQALDLVINESEGL